MRINTDKTAGGGAFGASPTTDTMGQGKGPPPYGPKLRVLDSERIGEFDSFSRRKSAADSGIGRLDRNRPRNVILNLRKGSFS